MSQKVKYILDEELIPTHWYNIEADLPVHTPPPVDPSTGEYMEPAKLETIFSRGAIEQEISRERYIEIPKPVREIMRQWRPSPLYRARRLEKALGTPARIYYKYEGVSPSGSHKTNSAIAQAFEVKRSGAKKVTTETGAGQWGSALSQACNIFGLECKVYMVKCSYEQKPYRKAMMELFGGTTIPSPSPFTEAGRAVLAKDPCCRGSLGIAISEAVEDAEKYEDTKYCLGSVLNHVLLHQTVIGQEAIKQMEMANDYPDIVIGACGGGSNFAGIAFPFIGEMLRGGRKVDVLGVEPAACPSLTKGKYAYDFGDVAKMTPMMKMYTLGSSFIPPAVHAGGLRYHGMAPQVSNVAKQGLMRARTVQQLDVFRDAVAFARSEGITPAPESSHAISAAMDEARKCKETGESKAILFNLSGHGHLDMSAYMEYFSGNLSNYEYPEQEIAMALSGLPVCGK
ncbi:tryptophan synthase beta chain 1 [Coraliomargarita sp. CAG:312]|nr:tryptophan synthase beta chain 1 [Coraliomargarita sp. CAG:312]